MKQKTLLKILLLSSSTITAIHFINKLIFHTATSKHLLDENKGEFYHWRFGKIFYNRYGSGSPLLLVHDLTTASSGAEWRKVVDYLSKDHTVYVIDLLGCGRSEKSNITYTNFLYVQLISDFIKNIIKHKTTVIATGLSGSFTVLSCYNNPDLFDKILLLNPPSPKELNKVPTKRSKTLKFFLNLPIFGTLIYNIVHSKNEIEKSFRNMYYDSSLIQQQDIDAYFESAHQKGVLSRFLFSSLKGNYVNLSITHALKEINHSIYLIGGSDLPSIHTVAEEYTQLNAAVETEFIKECKYLPQLETPKSLLHLLDIYLTEKTESASDF